MTGRLGALVTFVTLLCGDATLAQAPPRDTLRMVFAGDVNFARSLARLFIFEDRGAQVFASVRDRLRVADLAVANLESIILDRGRYADTTNSAVFAGPVEALPLLPDAGFDMVGTANNHAWDFGREGLLESLGHLERAGIPHTGTGATLDEAWRPVVTRARGWTVAFFALTAIFNFPDLTVIGHEAECCVAWADTARAARRFRTARDSLGADLVIAFVHAGPVEYVADPHPTVVQLFRGLARAGADAVIGHHPHVPQGVEWLGGAPIVYSLGNFAFRQYRPWTDRALVAELTVAPDGRRSLALLPVAAGYTPSFLGGTDSAAVIARVDSLSRRIGLPNALPRRNVARPRTRPGNK